MGLSETQIQRIKDYGKNEVNSNCRDLYLRVQLQKTRSYMSAIKAKCQNCMGYEQYVERIRECTASSTCPLWHYRPYQPGIPDEEEISI